MFPPSMSYLFKWIEEGVAKTKGVTSYRNVQIKRAEKSLSS